MFTITNVSWKKIGNIQVSYDIIVCQPDRKKAPNVRYHDALQKLLGRTMSVKIVVSVTELTNMDAKDRYVVEGIGESTF